MLLQQEVQLPPYGTLQNSNSLRLRKFFLMKMTPSQTQRYKLLALQQQTMIRLHLSPALLEISGTYDMDMLLPQSFASSISSSHHLTPANVFPAFVPRKLANLSLH